jgi:TPR repeat protein
MRNVLVATVIVLIAFGATAQTKVDALLVKANAGDVAAQIQVAKAYQFGDGVAKNMKESVRWYRAAAAKGNAEAAYTMGVLAYNGTVLGDAVQGSLVHSYVWFSVAANEQHPEAAEARDRAESELTQFNLLQAHELLAALYLHGKEVPANPDVFRREVDWLSEQETAEGKLLIAAMYLEGKDVQQDLAKAELLCTKAEADKKLGAHFCLGQIADKKGNAQAAFEHFQKDALLGYPAAMLEVAKRFRDGNGTKPDKILALAWAIQSDAGRVVGGHELNEELTAASSEKERSEALKKSKKMVIPRYSVGLTTRSGN